MIKYDNACENFQHFVWHILSNRFCVLFLPRCEVVQTTQYKMMGIEKEPLKIKVSIRL